MNFTLTASQTVQFKQMVDNVLFVGGFRQFTSAQAQQAYKLLFQWTSNAAGTAPASGMDLAVWTWIKGAKDINAGVGKFSVFIREYTAQQYKTRTGITLAAGKPQEASNAIATAVVQGILSGNGLIPDLKNIGQYDANPSTRVILPNQPALWSGNLLFILLGDSSHFTNNLLKKTTKPDTYDLLTAISCFWKAYKTAFPSSNQVTKLTSALQEVATAMGWTQALGNLSILNNALTAGNAHIRSVYGAGFDLFSLDTTSTSLAFSNLQLGTQNNDELFSAGKPEVIHGGYLKMAA
jgi:hypothetical protein